MENTREPITCATRHQTFRSVGAKHVRGYFAHVHHVAHVPQRSRRVVRATDPRAQRKFFRAQFIAAGKITR